MKSVNTFLISYARTGERLKIGLIFVAYDIPTLGLVKKSIDLSSPTHRLATLFLANRYAFAPVAGH
jgi:hypothetical protein